MPNLQDTYYTVSEEGSLMVTCNNQQQIESEALKLGPLTTKQTHFARLNSNGTGMILNNQDQQCSVQRLQVNSEVQDSYKDCVEKFENLINNDLMIEQVAQNLKTDQMYPDSLIDLVLSMGETED